ncbi:MAG: hypothetical protein N0C90_12905 [Candidatus Thiodiazotropha endolucinida]|nr:hypothetical protein [Candidatus Thiodiazotropha taylori]MCW4262260.1 hypothetical protein [Candidatus Thiodiazotropha endolucinida]
MISLRRVFHKRLSPTDLLDIKIDTLRDLKSIDTRLYLATASIKDNFDRISSEDVTKAASLVVEIDKKTESLWELSRSLKKGNSDAEGNEATQADKDEADKNEYNDFDFDDLDALDDDCSDEHQNSSVIEEEGQNSSDVDTANDVIEAFPDASEIIEPNSNNQHDDAKPQSLALRFDKEFIDELNHKIGGYSCQCGHHFSGGDLMFPDDGEDLDDGEYDETDNPRRIMWLLCPECDSEYKMTIRPRIWLTQQ